MINAGIDDGDLVVVRQQNTADYNQIVVALVDDEATLKRFRQQMITSYYMQRTPRSMILSLITVSFRVSR